MRFNNSHHSTVRGPYLARSYFVVGFILAIVLLPILSLLLIAFRGEFHELIHIYTNILPKAVQTTALLMVIVAVLTSVIGVTCAWLVSSFNFPFRKTLASLLVLPIAIAPYISAYCYVDFLHFTGPVQSLLRHLLGTETQLGYWFFEIRNVGGAGFIMSFTLYPYVYLASYVFFSMQTRSVADMARVLGASKSRVFFKVVLPMSRPAIMAGVSLALMETLNDIGASEYLGVQTITFSVYHTWLGKGSLAGAAQLSLSILMIIIFLIWIESYSRRMLRFHASRSIGLSLKPTRIMLSKKTAFCAMMVTMTPVIFGFVVPVGVLLKFALKRLDQFGEPAFLNALKNSMFVGASTAIVVMIACLCLLHFGRLLKGSNRLFVRICTFGYALPGTLLALGALYVFAFIDTQVNNFAKFFFNHHIGLIFSSSLTAIILVCSIRFVAVGETSLSAALLKLPENLDASARNLGASPIKSMRYIMLPLLRPALFSSSILIFVDTVKELSATILLRPVGFNTLATLVYENASRAAVEDGAMAALCIVALSLIPVVLLLRTLPNNDS
jgi:iron(III) transport system permease protein